MASRTDRRIFSLALSWAVLILHAGIATSDPRPSPAPTGLESFIARPTLVLDLAEDVGSLRSTDASVAVAAVIASDTGRPGEGMRGLRFHGKQHRIR